MKLIIAGGRDMIVPLDFIELALKVHGLTNVSQIVSGGARGIDTLGEELALFQNIPVERFDADWDRFGKSAGHIRNTQMAKYADKLLLIWDGDSPGSKNMKENMIKQGKPIHEIVIRKTAVKNDL